MIHLMYLHFILQIQKFVRSIVVEDNPALVEEYTQGLTDIVRELADEG